MSMQSLKSWSLPLSSPAMAMLVNPPTAIGSPPFRLRAVVMLEMRNKKMRSEEGKSMYEVSRTSPVVEGRLPVLQLDSKLVVGLCIKFNGNSSVVRNLLLHYLLFGCCINDLDPLLVVCHATGMPSNRASNRNGEAYRPYVGCHLKCLFCKT